MGTRTLARGLAAGLAGSAAMTAYQQLLARRSTEGEPTWESAPAPAKIARRVLGAVGVELSARRIPLASNIVQWTYGAALGLAVAGAYEALERRERPTRRRRFIGAGLAAGGAVGTILRRPKKERVPSFVRAPARTVRRVVPVR